ncbi:unnamed protein product [Penicillium viridicatum]
MPFSKQPEVENWEQKLYDYRESHYELSARVHISHLVFDTGFRRRMDSRQNIRRLQKIMKIQGCQRLMRDNHVPVMVPRAHWQDRVRPRSGSGIMPSLELELDYRLCAYDHENLITAARNFLNHDNQWWIVDVYLTDNEEVSPDDHRNEAGSVRHKFIQSLKERYPNDNHPPDGLIYERIIHYGGHLDPPTDPLAANNWWAVLERVLGSKKGNTFSRLVGGRDELLFLFDGVTVELLQSRVPKVSRKDLNSLQVELEGGRLFPNFPEETRQEVWARLKEIDYPIPTLKTFFKDRLYLEVAQSVMKRLFVQPRKEKITIDQGVYGKYNTSVPMPIALREIFLGSDLLEFWRFSFQARGFQAPLTDETSFVTGEIPSRRPCEYPEDLAEEIEVGKRCGKPYSNTVEADRFALSAESLRQSQASVRVTAGFLRQSVFKAFFGYLWNINGQMSGRNPPDDNIEVPTRDEGPTRADVGETMMVTNGVDVDSGSLWLSPLVTSAAQNHNATAAASAVDLPLSFCVMTITVGGTTRRLDLPIHDSFMKDFSTGLFNNNFDVQTDEIDRRSILPYMCYSHYLQNPSSVLHAEFRQDEHTTYDSTPSQIGTRSKRRRVDGDQQMDRAEIWLQEQIALLSNLRNSDEEL